MRLSWFCFGWVSLTLFVDDSFTVTVLDSSPIVTNPISDLIVSENQDNYTFDLKLGEKVTYWI